MPISFRQYDIVAPRKRDKLLNLRAPDDSLAYEDDGPPIARSPSVGQWVEAYFAADKVDDDQGRSTALKGVIESNRADHNAAGLPVYAHHPLPEDFAEALLRGARQTPLNRLLAKFELSVRPQIEKQFAARALLRGNTAGPAFEEHQRQESASRIERHAEGSPTSDASGMSEECGLLGCWVVMKGMVEVC